MFNKLSLHVTVRIDLQWKIPNYATLHNYTLIQNTLLFINFNKAISQWNSMTFPWPWTVKCCKFMAFFIKLFIYNMHVYYLSGIEWLVLRPALAELVGTLPRCYASDFHNVELILSCIYVMVLILLTLCFAVVTWDSEENHRESR